MRWGGRFPFDLCSGTSAGRGLGDLTVNTEALLGAELDVEWLFTAVKVGGGRIGVRDCSDGVGLGAIGASKYGALGREY